MSKADLEAWVNAYIQAQEIGVADASHPLWWSIDKFMEKVQTDPDLAWEAILSIAHRQPSQRVLGMLSAGPLEDLIEQHGEAFINRIEQVANTDASFRKMLENLWESGTPEVWQRIMAAQDLARP